MATTKLFCKALDHVAAAQSAHDLLEAAYVAPARNPAEVARLHQAIGRGLKLAEVYASLYVGQQVADLVRQAERNATLSGGVR